MYSYGILTFRVHVSSRPIVTNPLRHPPPDTPRPMAMIGESEGGEGGIGNREYRQEN